MLAMPNAGSRNKKHLKMKIIITGSLGRISKPLTATLIKNGNAVVVISSNADKQKDVETLGAASVIGSLEDVAFLAKTFTGADAVYCMIPYSPPGSDLKTFVKKIAHNYKQAIERSGVKHIVFISTLGADMDKHNGILAYWHIAENILNQLPSSVSIAFIRPVDIYYNVLDFIPTIKERDTIVSNYSGEKKYPWVSPLDIATAVAEEIVQPCIGERKVRYVASDELSGNEIATILGEAVGKPNLKWTVISDNELRAMAGSNQEMTKNLIEINASRDNGLLYKDYELHKPRLGKVKMKDYAKEFAQVYSKE